MSWPQVVIIIWLAIWTVRELWWSWETCVDATDGALWTFLDLAKTGAVVGVLYLGGFWR